LNDGTIVVVITTDADAGDGVVVAVCRNSLW
jgi:hypothetical protein